MLKAFTWLDFLLASMVLSLLWWAVVWLLYFRRKKRDGESLEHAWKDEVDELRELEDGVMGKPALETGARVVEADGFSFGDVVEDVGDFGEVDHDQAAGQLEQLGDLADVQEEIRAVCRILADEDGSKEDFFTLFEMVRGKYPRLAQSASLPALKVFIREHVPFALSEQELDGLWM